MKNYILQESFSESDNEGNEKKTDKKIYNPLQDNEYQTSFFDKQKEKQLSHSYQKSLKIQKQINTGQPLLGKGVRFLPEYEQNIYPFSNSVLLRTISPGHMQSDGQQYLCLGSGVIVNINDQKYIATVCHNMYLHQTWPKSYAFLKTECQPNKIRKKMQIKKQMINYNKQFVQKRNNYDQPAFVEIQSSLVDVVKGNSGLEILFDWKQIDRDRQNVYLMGFPFKQNKKIIDMKDIDNSISIHLCFRKIKVQKRDQDNKFLLYKTTTQGGESGGALVLYRLNKFYLIGLHIGGSKQQKVNVGVLFKSDLKQKFPHIFLQNEKPNVSENQIEQKTAIGFFQYLIHQYNTRNDRGNQSGQAKDWSDFWGRVLKQYLTKLKPLEKNQKCKGTLHRIFSNIKQRKSRYDQLMNVPNRNYQFSESTIAKQLRVHVLPAAQALVKILQGDEKIISVSDLQQYHQPYTWEYFRGGRRQPYE